MENKVDRKGFINNPLGIIGLFLVIVEGIAGGVIAISTLPENLNNILVWFIVIFPFAVLFTFVFLVTKHHTKLYSPKDYENEDNFMFFYDKNTMERRKVLVSQGNNDIIQENLTYKNKLFTIGVNHKMDNANTIILALVNAKIPNVAPQIYIKSDSSASNSKNEYTSIWISEKADIPTSIEALRQLKIVAPHINRLYIYQAGRGSYNMFVGAIKNFKTAFEINSPVTVDQELIDALDGVTNLNEFVKVLKNRLI